MENSLVDQSLVKDLLNENARLKKANNLLEQVFQNTGIGIRLIDTNFNIIRVNDTYAQMADLINADYAEGQKCFKHLNCGRCGTNFCPLIRIIEGDKYVEHECEKEFSEGKVIHFHVTGQPILDFEGKITGVIEMFRDITNHKYALEALRRSENRFRLYIQSSPDGVAITDKSGKYHMVNPALCDLLGYSESELLQLRVKNVDSSDHFHKLIETGTSKGEVELFRKDASTVFVDIHAVALEDGYNIALLRDSTERREAERALISEVELNTVVAELAHMFLSTTEVEQIASVLLEKSVALTESQCGYNGYVDSATGQFSISNLAGNVKEICQPNKGKVINTEFRGLWGWALKHKEPLLTNSAAGDERAAGIPAGHMPIHRFLSVPALVEGVLIGQISVANSVRDYTERDLKILQRLTDIYAIALQRKHAEQKVLESEQQYNLIINGTNDAVILYEVVNNKDFRILKGNNTLSKILGLPLDEVKGKSIKDVVPKGRANILTEQYTRAVRSKEPVVFDVSVPNHGMYEARCIPVINDKGESSHLVVVAQNISEKRQAEDHLLKLQKLESVGILAGGIAHDFNNILTAITGNVSLAKLKLNNMKSEGAGALLNLLDEAEKASLEAKNLTQQLLTFAKGGAPIIKTTSTTELLKGITEFALRGSNVKCIFEIPGDIWAVEVDEGQISQVIHNLVINADQAMPGGGKVEIKAENIVVNGKSGLPLEGGRYVKISVADHGVGIPPEFLNNIFDPYFTTKQKGSGLGLTSSYSIVRKHGGILEVQSELGIGTRFEMYLPATEALVIREEIRKDASTTGKGKVLVMDDDKMLRFMLSEMLEYLGYEAACAKDGVEAIDMYSSAKKAKKPYDAIIMDLTIPGGMGGKEAIQKLIEIDPEAAAIVSSGYSNDPIMSEYEKYGFRDVVSKPYSVEELAETLRKVIEIGG